MINEAKKLREEFEQKMKELQENCKHPKWIWIPQPLAGSNVSPWYSLWIKICQRCDQIIEHKVTSKNPMIISSEDEWV